MRCPAWKFSVVKLITSLTRNPWLTLRRIINSSAKDDCLATCSNAFSSLLDRCFIGLLPLFRNLLYYDDTPKGKRLSREIFSFVFNNLRALSEYPPCELDLVRLGDLNFGRHSFRQFDTHDVLAIFEDSRPQRVSFSEITRVGVLMS